MRDELLKSFLDVLGQNAWHIELTTQASAVPACLSRAPELLRQLATAADSITSADQAAWFFGALDYARDDDMGWRRVEETAFEIAAGSPDHERDVRAFWSRYLPFAMQVRGDYGYLAIDEAGLVVSGFAPEIEDTSVVAASYEDFLRLAIKQCKAGAGEIFEMWIRE